MNESPNTFRCSSGLIWLLIDNIHQLDHPLDCKDSSYKDKEHV